MERQRPNILFLLTDNQHWTSMGAAGNDIISTPYMDDLAARGVMFDNSFVTTPICGASRAASSPAYTGAATSSTSAPRRSEPRWARSHTRPC